MWAVCDIVCTLILEHMHFKTGDRINTVYASREVEASIEQNLKEVDNGETL